jgi:hypothetical protein
MALFAKRTPAPAKSTILVFLMSSLHLVGNSTAGRSIFWGHLRSNRPRFIWENERAAIALTLTDIASCRGGAGKAATSATARPPAEKRTQITSAIRQEKVEEVTNVNFTISVGTTVPAGVRYHPMPSHVVEIYPEWRGYDFILVRGKYIVLRPHTHEIVYIIEG